MFSQYSEFTEEIRYSRMGDTYYYVSCVSLRMNFGLMAGNREEDVQYRLPAIDMGELVWNCMSAPSVGCC